MTAPTELDLIQYYALHFGQIKVAPYFKCKMMSPFLLLFLLEWHHVMKTLMYVAFMGYQSMEIPFKCCLCWVDVSRIRSIGSSHFSIKKDLPLLPFLVPLPSCTLGGGGRAGATYVKGKKGGGEDN
jgi:hypothetical protein